MTVTEQHRYLTVAEVARELRISARTVRRLVARGEILGVRIGSQLRIPSEQLDRLTHLPKETIK